MNPDRYDETDHEANRRLIESQNKTIKSQQERLTIALRAMITAGILFLIAGAVVTIQIVSYIDDLETERQARAASISQIITQTCQTNNEQDQILATLIDVSLRTQSFGSGVDQSTLSAFDIQVIASINNIQESQQANPQSEFQQVFEEKLAELRDLTDCKEQVDRYLSGEPQLESEVK